jgi:hypothetical protein
MIRRSRCSISARASRRACLSKDLPPQPAANYLWICGLDFCGMFVCFIFSYALISIALRGFISSHLMLFTIPSLMTIYPIDCSRFVVVSHVYTSLICCCNNTYGLGSQLSSYQEWISGDHKVIRWAYQGLGSSAPEAFGDRVAQSSINQFRSLQVIAP